MHKFSFCLPAMIGLASHCLAQVQVSQEPRHHIVLENEYVRILDVRIPPHDTTLMHKHSTPSVFVVLSNTKSGSEVLIEPGKPASTAGGIWFEGFYDKPRVHRVWNEDTAEFHVMDIELLHQTPLPVKLNFALVHSQSLFDEKQVHGFKMTFAPNDGMDFKSLPMPALVIGLSGPGGEGLVNDQHFTKKGDFLFVPAGSDLEIWNDSKTREQQFALFLLK